MDNKIIYNKLILFVLLLLLSTTCYGQTEQAPGEDWDILYNCKCFTFDRYRYLSYFSFYADVWINLLITGNEASSNSLVIYFHEGSLGIELNNLFLFPPPPTPRPSYPLTGIFQLKLDYNLSIINGVLDGDMIILFSNSGTVIPSPVAASHFICWGSS